MNTNYPERTAAQTYDMYSSCMHIIFAVNVYSRHTREDIR